METPERYRIILGPDGSLYGTGERIAELDYQIQLSHIRTLAAQALSNLENETERPTAQRIAEQVALN